ncbi:ABC transporter ATP-binding protein [Candidatus Dependentiae bacterium]|nr:ABC transporter ATP-binding protein [Candidatus Dependentiae bacterium]
MNGLLNFIRMFYGWMFPKITVLPVDFKNAWWKIISRQKKDLALGLSGEVISGIFGPLRILLLGYIFSVKRFDYLIYLFVGWLLIYAWGYVGRLFAMLVKVRSVYSVQYHAHKFLLQVDPVYHTNRQSGVVLSKIDRASKSYEEFLQTFFFDLVELPISIITVLISLSFISPFLSLFIALLFGLILWLSIGVFNPLAVGEEQRFIKADDALKGLFVEHLVQINLIRTAFASGEVNARMEDKSISAAIREGAVDFLFNTSFNVVKCIYLLSLISVSVFVFNGIQYGSIDAAVGIAIVMGYLRGTYDVIKIEKPLRIVFRSMTRIKDLYNFIVSYGKQSYPVLRQHGRDAYFNFSVAQQESIQLNVRNLFFDFNAQARLFNDHFLELDVSRNQENKLYGIIGPSGVGKSTLLSILGGQLRPVAGQVLINGVDIYQVDDMVRSRLIAVQGQTAASLRGTLRYNLLFGLPLDYTYSDEMLLNLLENVGLREIFASKQGLETLVGEGGQTMSGGQRQRLNFANLYLRARYYKPPILLIDEPTSSLDEISERAITDMIIDLAQDSLTFVIAHRLKTIDQAVGILDCSLLTTEKKLIFYSQQELAKHSVYYHHLMTGIDVPSQ